MEKKSWSATKDARDAAQLDEQNALRVAQIEGDIEMVTCNKDSSYQIPAHEADKYLMIKTVIKNAQNNKDVSLEKSVIKVHKDSYAEFEKHASQHYDTYVILHDPRKEAEKSTANVLGNEAEQGKKAEVVKKDLPSVEKVIELAEKEIGKKEAEISEWKDLASKKAGEIDEVNKALANTQELVNSKDAEIAALRAQLAAGPSPVVIGVGSGSGSDQSTPSEETKEDAPAQTGTEPKAKKGRGA